MEEIEKHTTYEEPQHAFKYHDQAALQMPQTNAMCQHVYARTHDTLRFQVGNICRFLQDADRAGTPSRYTAPRPSTMAPAGELMEEFMVSAGEPTSDDEWDEGPVL